MSIKLRLLFFILMSYTHAVLVPFGKPAQVQHFFLLCKPLIELVERLVTRELRLLIECLKWHLFSCIIRAEVPTNQS
ncbi:hypothetical protein KC19_VG199300 [Ceratodon purpureus]|uniref:Secreted protein n=1 Tax=Ceratodon purpureus TaxID=3225 RepID=A0A8T0HT02_CERPU|nr:hypothetical protein KC19_VG199300 [Ceratodon purpureus]